MYNFMYAVIKIQCGPYIYGGVVNDIKDSITVSPPTQASLPAHHISLGSVVVWLSH